MNGGKMKHRGNEHLRDTQKQGPLLKHCVDKGT